MNPIETRDMPEIAGGTTTASEPAEEPLAPVTPWEQDYPGEPMVGSTDPSGIELAR